MIIHLIIDSNLASHFIVGSRKGLSALINLGHGGQL